MFHQPSVTSTESRHGVLQTPFSNDGRHWQAPDVRTLTTPRSPQSPVPRTTASNIPDVTVIADDPEFVRKVWAYIRNQLHRLQETNVKWTARRMRLLDAFTLMIITTTTITIIIAILRVLLLLLFTTFYQFSSFPTSSFPSISIFLAKNCQKNPTAIFQVFPIFINFHHSNPSP
jgi:hypothetical protein